MIKRFIIIFNGNHKSYLFFWKKVTENVKSIKKETGEKTSNEKFKNLKLKDEKKKLVTCFSLISFKGTNKIVVANIIKYFEKRKQSFKIQIKKKNLNDNVNRQIFHMII